MAELFKEIKLYLLKLEADIDFGGPRMMLSPKKGGYIKAVRGTMVDGRGQGKVMRTRKTTII
jgi:hypothetical protein